MLNNTLSQLSFSDYVYKEHVVHGTLLNGCFQNSNVLVDLGFASSKWSKETLEQRESKLINTPERR